MKSIILISLLLASMPWMISSSIEQNNFIQCMAGYKTTHSQSSKITFTQTSLQYTFLLQSSQQNLRWLNSSSSSAPSFIITPSQESEVQAAIICSQKQGLQVRVLSGGHDYEGLSYRSKAPFVIIDLINMRLIDINLEDETAWVQSGSTIGELYYAIASRSRTHAFPAGLCPTVGIGGHFSGGGLGTLSRKYGLAADNVIDAYLVDVNGRILDRKGMGEDLFWAIRGGGGASFGIILSWKIKLARVPEVVTTFTISKTVKQGATELVKKWQHVADKFHKDLFVRVIIQIIGDTESGKTVQASFNSLFLGGTDRLTKLMNQTFPELGLKAKDCNQMSWIESTLYFAGFQKGQPLEVLLNRSQQYKSSFKAKSDFVTQPIPEDGLEGLWTRFLEEKTAFIIMDPFGGKMNDILESFIPFPHRKGNIYNIQYLVKWEENSIRAANKHIHWIRMIHKYMSQYVSKSPRAAYLNYRDLDLGTNNKSNQSYKYASHWGFKYFKRNFERLAHVKYMTDPQNYLRHEQSIPPLTQY